MRTMYIATAVKNGSDHVQENAYGNPQRAMKQAIKMCEDLKKNLNWDVEPLVVPIDFYADNEEPHEAPPEDQHSITSGSDE